MDKGHDWCWKQDFFLFYFYLAISVNARLHSVDIQEIKAAFQGISHWCHACGAEILQFWCKCRMALFPSCL